MRVEKHPANTRGHVKMGWLDSHHSFSFGSYYNPDRMGFGTLRVLNDDVIDPGMGFDTHPHRDMEIISIPLTGALVHKDSMGNSTVIPAGDVQVMSAGTGVLHSEYNHDKTQKGSFLQLWVLPNVMNVEPRYAQKSYNWQEPKEDLNMIISSDGRDESLMIYQDTYMFVGTIEQDKTIELKVPTQGHGMYLFLIDGEVTAADQKLTARDALAITGARNLTMYTQKQSQVLLVAPKIEM